VGAPHDEVALLFAGVAISRRRAVARTAVSVAACLTAGCERLVTGPGGVQLDRAFGVANGDDPAATREGVRQLLGPILAPPRKEQIIDRTRVSYDELVAVKLTQAAPVLDALKLAKLITDFGTARSSYLTAAARMADAATDVGSFIDALMGHPEGARVLRRPEFRPPARLPSLTFTLGVEATLEQGIEEINRDGLDPRRLRIDSFLDGTYRHSSWRSLGFRFDADGIGMLDLAFQPTHLDLLSLVGSLTYDFVPNGTRAKITGTVTGDARDGWTEATSFQYSP
jgi:hypothetical protein